jgi:murein DD-endopeptidase MepM/ murein hydrolase activator NlpD
MLAPKKPRLSFALFARREIDVPLESANVTEQRSTTTMKRISPTVQLLFCAVCLLSLPSLAEGDCPSDMECVKVVEQRQSCPDGATCTTEAPEQLTIDCYMDLVASPDAYVSGEYGEMRDGGPHNGVDLAVPTGTDVFAAKAGKVYELEGDFEEGDKTTYNGNYVRIKYDDGTEGGLHPLAQGSG